MKAERNYSIDLLKCISMLMIVILHLNNYGLRNAEYSPFDIIGVTSSLLQSFSIVGVNIFVLITGYFLSGKSNAINKENLTAQYKRLLPLWIQVEMYSIGVYLVLCAIPQSGVQFGFRQLIKQAFPLFTGQYWFFTEYFLLILVVPFINKLICCLEQKEYRLTLFVLLITFSVLPTINIFGNSFDTSYGYGLLWFVVLFLIGGYIRKYNVKNRKYGLIYLGFAVFFFICHLLSNIMPKPIPAFLNVFFDTYTSVFVLGASLSLFLAFLKSKHTYKKSGKFISALASLSFAVYLIHEHNSFRDVLWEQIIGLGRFADDQRKCLLLMLISVVCIYIGGILIEFIRVKIIDLLKLIFKLWRKNEPAS